MKRIDARDSERLLDSAALEYATAHARWLALTLAGATADPATDRAWIDVVEAKKRHHEAAFRFIALAPKPAIERVRAHRERQRAATRSAP